MWRHIGGLECKVEEAKVENKGVMHEELRSGSVDDEGIEVAKWG